MDGEAAAMEVIILVNFFMGVGLLSWGFFMPVLDAINGGVHGACLFTTLLFS
jgi:hypothetical protein